ncbi:MAG TPA: hypothetical protein VH640_21700 [Bryobacteraceae bacterium]
MSSIANRLNSRSRCARLAVIALVSGTLWLGSARAQPADFEALASAASVPYSLFQYATLTGSSNTVTATFVPIVTAGGTSYANITLAFNVSASGALTIASLQQTPALAPIVSSFRAGKYCAPVASTACIVASGPGETSGGTTEWALAQAAGAWGYTYPQSATWYVGPLASSPLAPRLAAAKITSTDYSYGTVGAEYWSENGTWLYNTLIGLSQIGNTLTIVSFTKAGLDQNTPVDQITYSLCNNSCPN